MGVRIPAARLNVVTQFLLHAQIFPYAHVPDLTHRQIKPYSYKSTPACSQMLICRMVWGLKCGLCSPKPFVTDTINLT